MSLLLGLSFVTGRLVAQPEVTASGPTWRNALDPLVTRLGQRWRWRALPRPPGAGIICIGRSPEGSLIAISRDSGIARFDGHRWTVQPIPDCDQDVDESLESLHGVGSVFYGFSRQKIVRFDPQQGCHAESFPHLVTRPYCDPTGRLLVAMRDRIYRMTPAGREPYLEPLPSELTVFGLGGTPAGELWVATNRGVLRHRNGQWERVPGEQPAATEAPLRHLVHAGSSMWLFTDTNEPHVTGYWWDGRVLERLDPSKLPGGLFATARLSGDRLVLAPHSGGLAVVHGSATDKAHVPLSFDECLTALVEIEDADGARYLTCLTEGERIAVCHLSSDRWLCRLPSRAGLHNNVNALAPSRRGGLWIGTHCGVARFDGQQFTDVHREIHGRPLSGVTAVLEDERGHLWVGAGAGITGVYRFDGTAWHLHQEPEGVGQGRVHAIRAGTGGSIWFLMLGTDQNAVWTGGDPQHTVVVRRDREGRWKSWTRAHGLPGNRAYDLVTGRDGRTFVATSHGVVYLDGDRWHPLTDREGHPLRERVFCLCAASDGSLWMGPGSCRPGVARFRDGRCEQMEGPDWSEVAAADILEDRRGRLWFASRRGLYCYDGTICYPISRSRGLPARNFWPLHETPDGDLWIGALGRGLLRYRADDRHAPRVQNVHVALSPDGRNAHLSWQGADRWNTTVWSQVVYRWRLDGGAWSPPIRHRDVELRNLPRGAHTFEVQASDLAGNTSPEDPSARIGFFFPFPWYIRIEVVLLMLVCLLLVLALTWNTWRGYRERTKTLAASEARYRRLVEGVEFALLRYDAHGRIQDLSPQIEQLTGYSAEEIRARPALLIQHVHPDQRGQVATLAARRRGKNPDPHDVEFRFRRRDGAWRWLFVRQRARFDTHGRLEGFDETALDITESKNLENDLVRAREALLHAQKLESLGVLAGGIAHDFNNLLVGVLGYAALARQSVDQGSRLDTLLAEIESAGQRASGLCQHLLTYSGRGKVEMRPIDVTDLVARMLPLLEMPIPENVSLHTCLETPLPPVLGDPAQLNQVVMNLILNASEALATSVGSVTVKTGTVDADASFFEEVRIGRNCPAGTYVSISVVDTAGRLEPEQLDRIFDPFFTTKTSGRGLGLAAVLGIVRGHGGALEVKVNPGQSTGFTVFLPATAAQKVATPARAPASDVPDAPRRGHGTVLVIDDNPMVSTVARGTLKELGFEVCTARDGEAGLEEFRRRLDHLAAVLLDMNMPRKHGTEVLAEIRKQTIDLPVLLMSGFDESEVSIRCAGDPRTGFLQKPYTPSQLTGAIWSLLPEESSE